MLKKFIVIGIVVAVVIILFCLGHIQYDLSLKEDNTVAVEVIG